MIPVQRSVRGRSTIARDRVRTNHEDDIQTHMDGQEEDHIPGDQSQLTIPVLEAKMLTFKSLRAESVSRARFQQATTHDAG